MIGLMSVPASSTATMPHQLDVAGLGVHLDDGDVRAERERGAGRLEVVLDVELAEPALGLEPLGQLRPGEALRGRADTVEARPPRGRARCRRR